MLHIPFHISAQTGLEDQYIHELLHTQVEKPFSERCTDLLNDITGSKQIHLTPSCTAALEMAALLCEIKPGDEVIMPSFTFVSSANPFVLRGATIVFVDIDPNTMNANPYYIELAITPQTKAIVVMHYGGFACDMDEIMQIAYDFNLWVIEDAAHCIGASYKNRHLGAIGHLGTLSFHNSKNIHCMEGGALLINDERLRERAHLIYEKGTNRRTFLEGRTDKYTWVDIGSSFAISELSAAYLYAQLLGYQNINKKRAHLWQQYALGLESLQNQGHIALPPLDSKEHNAHIFYIKCEDTTVRKNLMAHLRSQGIQAYFHYVPLHDAPAGLKYGRLLGSDTYTTLESGKLLRLPLYDRLTEAQVAIVIHSVLGFYKSHIKSIIA